MLIEFVGISGSGKSTVIAAVTSELRNRGIKVRNLYKFCESAQLIDEHHWKQSAPQEQHLSVPSDVAETRALERVPAKRRQAVSKARPSIDHFTSLSNMLGRLTEGARRAGRRRSDLNRPNSFSRSKV